MRVKLGLHLALPDPLANVIKLYLMFAQYSSGVHKKKGDSEQYSMKIVRVG